MVSSPSGDMDTGLRKSAYSRHEQKIALEAKPFVTGKAASFRERLLTYWDYLHLLVRIC